MKEVRDALRAYCREKNRLEKEFNARMSYLLSKGDVGKSALKEVREWLVRAERKLADELAANVDAVVGVA